MALPATMGRRESVGRWHCFASTLARPGLRISDPLCISSPRRIWAVTNGFLDGAVVHHTAGQDFVQRLTGTLAIDVKKVATDGRRVVNDALELELSQSTKCAILARSAIWAILQHKRKAGPAAPAAKKLPSSPTVPVMGWPSLGSSYRREQGRWPGGIGTRPSLLLCIQSRPGRWEAKAEQASCVTDVAQQAAEASPSSIGRLKMGSAWFFKAPPSDTTGLGIVDKRSGSLHRPSTLPA